MPRTDMVNSNVLKIFSLALLSKQRMKSFFLGAFFANKI